MKTILLLALSTFGFAQSLPLATPMPYTQFQFFDNAGVPLAGGKVCSYAAGTSTPLVTYADAISGTPNTNPVTLDSAGRAQIWLGSKLYKIVIRQGGTPGTCTDGVVLTSADNVTDVALYFVNYVKTIGTASLLSYTNPATGGVSRTQYAKNNDVLSVKDLGAVGDGSTDDTAAFVQAIADSSLSQCIYVPDGVYRITAALVSTHPICFNGDTWRLKYTAAGTITGILSLIGDPVNTYGVHGSFMEGSFIQGAILDGQGHATNGLVLQGVVSAQINYMRVTNVTAAGVSCFWCQQTTFDRLQISQDFEPFTTVPQYGVIVDNISSANIFNQINIDHVSVDGIYLKYALNTLVSGGTSEGNGGWGVRCDGAASPFRQCFNNTFLQLDSEANTAGDYLFGFSSFYNSVFAANSSSTPGVVFNGDAHFNTITGGAIGGSSTGGASTFGNSLVSIGSFSLTDPVWTDSGQNRNDRIRNQFSGVVTEPANNYNNDAKVRFNPAGRYVETYTPTAALVDQMVGNATNWLGMLSQDGLATWLHFPTASPGFCFVSETAIRTGAVAEGCIVAHNWGFGRFNSAPAYRFHFFDAVTSTVAVQAGSGQGGADLMKFLDTTGATQLSGVSNSGKWAGPTSVAGTVFGVSGCGAGAITGGSTGGSFTVTTTGTCTATVTMGGAITAAHGWACSASSNTGPLAGIPTSATQSTIKGTTTSGDTVAFFCTAY